MGVILQFFKERISIAVISSFSIHVMAIIALVGLTRVNSVKLKNIYVFSVIANRGGGNSPKSVPIKSALPAKPVPVVVNQTVTPAAVPEKPPVVEDTAAEGRNDGEPGMDTNAPGSQANGNSDGDAGGAMGSISELDEVPRIIKQIKPDYPELARVRGVEAKVAVKFLITENGTIGRVQILQCGAPGWGFEENSIAAVKRWKYTIPKLRGYPVAVWHITIIRFNFRDE